MAAARHQPEKADQLYYVPYTPLQPRAALRAGLVRFEMESFDLPMIPNRPPLAVLAGDPRSDSTRKSQPAFTGDSTGLTDTGLTAAG